MAINNFDYIREWLSFDGDSVYHIMLMSRSKDGHYKSTSVYKDYYVTSIEYFDKIKDTIIATCDEKNCRAVINLNRKSIRKTNHMMIARLNASLMNNDKELPIHMYPSVLDAASDNGESGWFLDFDCEEGKSRDDLMPLVNECCKFLEEKCQPFGDKCIGILPSKTGLHVFISKCNVKPFTEKYKDIHVMTNSPTNLYIPGDFHA